MQNLSEISLRPIKRNLNYVTEVQSRNSNSKQPEQKNNITLKKP